jgi:hypothetical protein
MWASAQPRIWSTVRGFDVRPAIAINLPLTPRALFGQKPGQGRLARQATVAAPQSLIDVAPGLARGISARTGVGVRPPLRPPAVGIGPSQDLLDG